MAQALPIHIISEIERRWQRRLDSQPQAQRDQNADGGAEPCPLCGTAVTIEPAISGNTAARRVCGGCGHAWGGAAQ